MGREGGAPLASHMSTNYIDVMARVEAAMVQP